MLRNLLCIAAIFAVCVLNDVSSWSMGLIKQTNTPRSISRRGNMVMEVKNDAAARANREMRRASATDRVVELRKPMGMELDEDKDGNVFVKSIEKGGRADKSGMVFEGDYVTMVSATFGEDLWSCRNVGLTRVLSCIKVRNTKPVKLVLEASTPAEEQRRRAIAYAPPSPEQIQAKKVVSKLAYLLYPGLINML